MGCLFLLQVTCKFLQVIKSFAGFLVNSRVYWFSSGTYRSVHKAAASSKSQHWFNRARLGSWKRLVPEEMPWTVSALLPLTLYSEQMSAYAKD